MDAIFDGEISIFSFFGIVLLIAKTSVEAVASFNSFFETGSEVFSTLTGAISFFRTTGLGLTTSYAIYVDEPNIANSNTALKTRLYDLEVTNNAYILGSVGIGTTNPIEKLDVFGNISIGTTGTEFAKISRKNTNSGIAIGGGSTAYQSTGANIELMGRPVLRSAHAGIAAVSAVSALLKVW